MHNPAAASISLMVVGAPKAGTTSLKAYLESDSRLLTHERREFIFFASDRAYAEGYQKTAPHYFPGVTPDSVVAAKSVAMMYDPAAMERLKRHNRHCVVVLSLRNPIDRAYSEYWYARKRGWETESSFDVVIESLLAGDRADPRQPNAYLKRGEYAPYVRKVAEIFPPENVRVFTLDQLKASPERTCDWLTTALGLGSWQGSAEATQRQNVMAGARSERLQRVLAASDRFSGVRHLARWALPPRYRYKVKDRIQSLNQRQFVAPPMSRATRDRLIEHYSDINLELARDFGLEVESWLV